MSAFGWFLIMVSITSATFWIALQVTAVTKANQFQVPYWQTVAYPAILMMPALAGLILLEVAA